MGIDSNNGIETLPTQGSVQENGPSSNSLESGVVDLVGEATEQNPSDISKHPKLGKTRELDIAKDSPNVRNFEDIPFNPSVGYRDSNTPGYNAIREKAENILPSD